jgi:hypothetical protein
MAPTVQPYVKPQIKDPGDDPVIAMARLRHAKGLEVESQKRSVSALSGGVLHKHLELTDIEREIKIIEEGIQEYQDQINLMEEKRHDIEKQIKPHHVRCRTSFSHCPRLFAPILTLTSHARVCSLFAQDWCETFDRLIGPFEAKYEECKAEVKVHFDNAKRKYDESLQKLIDDFGFHPAFKRWFDDF